MELNATSDTAEVLRASQPYNLVSKTTAGVATTLSHTIVSKSLARLEKMGMIQEQKVEKIEKNGRPERIYRLTEEGAVWLQTNGFGNVSVLTMSDSIDLAHRYCQALVGTLTPFGTKVEFEKVIPLAGGRNIRFDVAVPLSNGLMQFIEIEQKLERKNIARAIEKFKTIGELLGQERRRARGDGGGSETGDHRVPQAQRAQSVPDQGAAYYEARYRERLVEGLRRRAKQLGLDVVPLATAP